jgi:hypothetical protein
MRKERKYKPTETGNIEIPEDRHRDLQRIIQRAEEDIEAARGLPTVLKDDVSGSFPNNLG